MSRTPNLLWKLVEALGVMAEKIEAEVEVNFLQASQWGDDDVIHRHMAV